MQHRAGRIVSLFLTTLAAACAAPSMNRPPTVTPAAEAWTDDTGVAAGNRAFGLALYRQLATEPGNVFVSPISIAGAFGPVIAGAGGETRQAIARALRFPAQGGEALPRALGGLLRDLERPREGSTVAIANALWAGKDFRIKPAFLALARDDYDAKVETLDFARAPEAAAARINEWASRETRARIPTLVSAIGFNESTRLVVTNAVYFLGDWAAPFNASATSMQPFHTSAARSVSAPLMYRSGTYRYFETEAFQAIDLPYRDGGLAMTVFLPKARNGLRAFEAELSSERLAEWLRTLDGVPPREVRIHLPKLKIEKSYDLLPALDVLGMGVAFGGRADFTGIADAPLAIGRVVHKTFVRIDEKGTEAAAATGIEIVVTSMRLTPVPVFRADRPFFFVLRDKASGAILFMGRIADPGTGPKVAVAPGAGDGGQIPPPLPPPPPPPP